MTEAEWLASDDPEEMYFRGVKPLKVSRRRTDLFCVACVRLVWHLLEDEGAKQAFEWLEEYPGQRIHPNSGAQFDELFQGPARALYDAHHRRDPGVRGAALHIAYDFWLGWYEYAFPNLYEWINTPQGALCEDPRTYLSAALRDIFGNPSRPVAVDPSWRTSTTTALAAQMYDSRDFSAMPILADALQDAGCENTDILDHCRGPGQHARGCWVVDLVLGKE